MIKLQILGNIGNDSTIKHFDNNRSVCNFSLAHTKTFKNKDGVKEQTTTWIDCNYWGTPDFVNKIAPYLKKGKKVYVEGEPSARAYIPTGGGDPKATLALNIFQLEFADGPAGDKSTASTDNSTAAANQTNKAPEYAPPADISSAAEEDDLPFN